MIITVDVRDEACAMSRELGADHALNARTCDVVAAIRELTGGNGADVVFECAGGSPKQGLAGNQTLLQAIDAVRSGGKIIGVSWFGGPRRDRRRPAPRAQLAVPLSRHQHARPTWSTRSGWWRRAVCG